MTNRDFEKQKNMSKIIIFGKNGQLSNALADILEKQKTHEFKFLSFPEFDFSNPQDLQKNIQVEFENFKPDFVINSAAYTKVDLAETERDLANKINFESPKVIADICKKMAICFIHVSSDYVYGGEGEREFKEEDFNKSQSNLNWYAKTKLFADAYIEENLQKFFIVRTSWVYDKTGVNFANTMKKLFGMKEVLKVVSDQIGSPTYAPDIADFIMFLIEKGGNKFGTYNFRNNDFCSWFDFAKEIFNLTKNDTYIVKEILPIPSSEYPTPASRPLNSKMSLEKIKREFSYTPRSWKAALAECLVG
jgi:dTDP-4-dehydrorhamnose reductase